MTVRGETVQFASVRGPYNDGATEPGVDYYFDGPNGKPLMYVHVGYNGQGKSSVNNIGIQKYDPQTGQPSTSEHFSYRSGAETKTNEYARIQDPTAGKNKLIENNFAGQVLGANASAADVAAFNNFMQERAQYDAGDFFSTVRNLQPAPGSTKLQGQFKIGAASVSYEFGENVTPTIKLLTPSDPNGKAYLQNEFNKWRASLS